MLVKVALISRGVGVGLGWMWGWGWGWGWGEEVHNKSYGFDNVEEQLPGFSNSVASFNFSPCLLPSDFWYSDRCPILPRHVLARRMQMYAHQWPLLLIWINFNVCISNHMPSKVRGEIAYPHPNFNGGAAGIWEWMINFNPRSIINVIT